MFDFTTTTVINSLKDFTTEKDLIQHNSEGFQVKRHNFFKYANITCLYKAPHVDPKNDEVSITNLTGQNTDLRIELYIRSIGNADPMYANNLVFKGKPLYIEVPAGTTKENLEKIVTKYMNLVFGGEAQLTATVNSDNGTLTLKCNNPFQRITKCEVKARSNGESAPIGQTTGEFTVDATTLKSNATAITPVHGTEGFGDYDHMIKDLRLPTGANLRWKRTMEDEMPIPGAFYDQYTIYYEVERGVMGLGAVGMKATSITTHVFWVNSALINDFEAAIGFDTIKNAKKVQVIGASSGVSQVAGDKHNQSGTTTPQPSQLGNQPESVFETVTTAPAVTKPSET